jgi:hypothetical protein
MLSGIDVALCKLYEFLSSFANTLSPLCARCVPVAVRYSTYNRMTPLQNGIVQNIVSPYIPIAKLIPQAFEPLPSAS